MHRSRIEHEDEDNEQEADKPADHAAHADDLGIWAATMDWLHGMYNITRLAFITKGNGYLNMRSAFR